MSDRDDALHLLVELTSHAAELDRRVHATVAAAVHHGATWKQVADALGVSAQAAHKRYRNARYDPTTRRVWQEPPLPI